MALQIPFQVGDNTYCITSSDKSYEISEYRNIKPVGSDIAVPTLCPFKWFGTIEGVILAVLNMQVRASDARSLEEMKDFVAECTDRIVKEFSIMMPHIPNLKQIEKTARTSTPQTITRTAPPAERRRRTT